MAGKDGRGNGRPRNKLQRAATATRSGLKRYPKHILDSLIPSRAAPRRGPRSAPDLCEFGGEGMSAIWLGHATVLLNLAGATILTDPVFSHRIGMSIGRRTFGLGRNEPVAIDAHHLPPVDVVLLSHAHFDHLDKPSLRQIASPATTVVTAANTRRLIPRGFRTVIEMDWGQRLGLPKLKLAALQPEHWGARTAYDAHRGYNAYVLEAEGQRILFAGDTAHTDAFDALGPINLAVFGIGAYEPWNHAHATPEEVWDMFTRLGARYLLPMHHSTFDLGEKTVDEPMQRLLKAAGRKQGRIICKRPGDVWCG
jgi:L-ascorbate metabolism protein UlaG (beta-lactamase superfamily)